MRGAEWAADFNTEGEIRTERKPHSWPAKHRGSGTTYRYMIFKGYSLLCGDEGKMRGLEHLYKKKDWDGGDILSLSEADAVDQTYQDPNTPSTANISTTNASRLQVRARGSPNRCRSEFINQVWNRTQRCLAGPEALNSGGYLSTCRSPAWFIHGSKTIIDGCPTLFGGLSGICPVL